MQIIHWKTPVAADWKRALDLKDIRLSNNGLRVEVEEESGKSWVFEFGPLQAWKVTAEECAGNIVSQLPIAGSLFILEQSLWLDELGKSGALDRSKHFVVCCYDEILEVLAWDCMITPKA